MATEDIKKNAEELGKKAQEGLEKAKEMLNPEEMKQKVSELGDKAQDAVNKAKEMLNSDDLKKKANEIGDKAQEQFNKAKDFLKSDDLGQKSKEAFENLKGQVLHGDSATKKKIFTVIGSVAAILLLAFFFLGDSGDIKTIKKSQLPAFKGKTIEDALSDYKYFSGGSWGDLSEEKQNEYKRASQAASYIFSNKKNKVNVEIHGFTCYTTKYTGLYSDIIPERFKNAGMTESLWKNIAKKLDSEIGNVELSIHFGIIETQQAVKMLTMGIEALEKMAENDTPKSKYSTVPLGCIVTYKGSEFKINNEDVLKSIAQNIPINLYTSIPTDTTFVKDLASAAYEETLKGLKGKQFAYILGGINDKLRYEAFVTERWDQISGIIHFPIVLGKVEDVSIDKTSKSAVIKVNSQVKNITLADLNLSYKEVEKTLSKSDVIASVEKADNLQVIGDTLTAKIPNYIFTSIEFKDAKDNNRYLRVEFDNINRVYLNPKADDKTTSFMQQRHDKFAESNTDFSKEDVSAKASVFHNFYEGINIDKNGISFDNENGTATLSYREDYQYHLDVVTKDNSCNFSGICRANRIGTIYCSPDEPQLWNKKYIVVDFQNIGALEITKSSDKSWCKGNGSIIGSYRRDSQ